MDFRLSPAEARFQREVHEWLVANLPAGWGTPDYRKPEEPAEKVRFARGWQGKLHEGGWAGLHWPREYGGRGASPIEQFLFAEEYTRVGAPAMIDIGVGPALVGPTLIHHGTEAQKRRFLRPILTGEEVWCQGFSEPNAGSDLAACRTRAELRGQVFHVTGQKIWTSYARFADWCILVVRTDVHAPKHKGLSGGSAPHARLAGEMHDVLELARRLGTARDRRWRQRLAQSFIETEILRLLAYKQVTDLMREGHPGPEGSYLKLVWSETDVRMKELALEMEGPYGALARGSAQAIDGGRWEYEYLWARAATIYAGTSEVQRNVIAQRVLGLPRGT